MYSQNVINAAAHFQRVILRECPGVDPAQIIADMDHVLPGIGKQWTLAVLAGEMLPEGYDQVSLLAIKKISDRIKVIKTLRTYFRLSLKDAVQYVNVLNKTEATVIEAPVRGEITKDSLAYALGQLDIQVIGFNYDKLVNNYV